MPAWESINEREIRRGLSDESETESAGRQLAACLRAGDVVALIGDLGAGKTRFVKAIAAALEVPPEEVNSPTFTLIQEYAGRELLRHCDAYRLRDPDEFADLGLDELFADDGIALIEWADRVTEYLPQDRIEIRLQIDSPTSRTITVKSTGNRSNRVLGEFRSCTE